MGNGKLASGCKKGEELGLPILVKGGLNISKCGRSSPKGVAGRVVSRLTAPEQPAKFVLLVRYFPIFSDVGQSCGSGENTSGKPNFVLHVRSRLET